MNEKKLTELEQLRQFLAGTAEVEFQPGPEDTRYNHIAEVLRRLQYERLKRPNKGLVLLYLTSLLQNPPHKQISLREEAQNEAAISH